MQATGKQGELRRSLISEKANLCVTRFRAYKQTPAFREALASRGVLVA